MKSLRNLLAIASLAVLSAACGLPVPFEYTTDTQQVDVDQLLGDNTFNVPAGEDAAAAQALIEEYLAEFQNEENWPEDLAEVKIDVPLLQTFHEDPQLVILTSASPGHQCGMDDLQPAGGMNCLLRCLLGGDASRWGVGLRRCYVPSIDIFWAG